MVPITDMMMAASQSRFSAAPQPRNIKQTPIEPNKSAAHPNTMKKSISPICANKPHDVAPRVGAPHLVQYAALAFCAAEQLGQVAPLGWGNGGVFIGFGF